jgi:Trp operon repressor
MAGSYLLADSFWFVDDKTRTFDGIFDEEHLEIHTTTPEDSYFVSNITRNNKVLVIQGNLRNEKKMTAITASFLSEETYHYFDKYAGRFRYSLKYVFYDAHLDSSDIKFKAIMVNFVNINKWITPWSITYAKDGIISDQITVEIEDADSQGINVYVVIESTKDEKSFEELFERMEGIQDFFNFVITENAVLPNSIYGIHGRNGEGNLITIKRNLTSYDDNMNKSNVKSPVLFRAYEHRDHLEKIIKKWFEFRNSHNTIYRYYMDSIYAVRSATELSYFTLAAFLEGYHRECFEQIGKSEIRKLKDSHFDAIEDMLKETEVDKRYIKIIKFLLADQNKLSLAQRLREIFEDYRDIVSVSGPVLSFFDSTKLNQWIREKSIDKNIKDKLIKVIDLKRQADCENMEQQRKEKYDEIIDFLKNEDPRIRNEMLLFVEFVLTQKFAAEFSSFRNIIVHVLDKKYQGISENKWIYAFMTLQLTGQLCILSLLEFTYQDIRKIFFLDSIEDIEKLAIMIRTNIGIQKR